MENQKTDAMKKVYLFFLTLSIVFFSVYGQTDVEKEIISDLIEAEFGSVTDELSINGKDQKDNCIIILSETFTQTISTRDDPLRKFLRRELAGLDSITMNDFIEKNLSSVKIPEFHLDQIKIIYLSQKEYEGIMEQGGWNQYHKIYGYIPTITISRPGINENMNKAFVYYGAISDKLGGSGFYLILERVNNKWIVKEKIIAWRS